MERPQVSGCFGCRLRRKKCRGCHSNRSCDTCRAQHIECFPCAIPVSNQIRNSKNARECRREMATLGNSRRNGIAQLPMTREFFEWFLRVAQSGDEDSDEQDMGHEVQNIPLVLTQPSNDGVDLHYDNLQGDMPQAGLATVDGVNMALGHVIPQSTEQPTDHESSIAPQPFAHFQAPIPPIHIATLESPQGSSWTSGDFQNPNANFGAGASVVPNVPVSVAPVPYTIEIDLQDVARRMGCILVPFS